jgi:hypothetical protein
MIAIQDQWGPRYGSQRHLHTRPGPMDDRCPAPLLLHSWVAPAYPCDTPVWRVVDCCHVARADEPYFAWVSPTLFTYMLYVSLQTCLTLTSTYGLFRAQDKSERRLGVRRIGQLNTRIILLCGIRELGRTTSMVRDIKAGHGWSTLGGFSSIPSFFLGRPTQRMT